MRVVNISLFRPVPFRKRVTERGRESFRSTLPQRCIHSSSWNILLSFRLFASPPPNKRLPPCRFVAYTVCLLSFVSRESLQKKEILSALFLLPLVSLKRTGMSVLSFFSGRLTLLSSVSWLVRLSDLPSSFPPLLSQTTGHLYPSWKKIN